MIDQSKQYALIPELKTIANVYGLDVKKVENLVHGFKFLIDYPIGKTQSPIDSPMLHQIGVAINFNDLVNTELDRRDFTSEQGLLTLLDALWYTAMARYTLENQKRYVNDKMVTGNFRRAVKQFYHDSHTVISLDNQDLIETELKMFDVAINSYDAFKYISTFATSEEVAQGYRAQEAKRNWHDLPKPDQFDLADTPPQLPTIALAGLFALLPDTIPVPVVAQVVGNATHFSPLEISSIVKKILATYQTPTA